MAQLMIEIGELERSAALLVVALRQAGIGNESRNIAATCLHQLETCLPPETINAIRGQMKRQKLETLVETILTDDR